MSVSDFFSSIADKAQNAINQTPLAGHIPGTTPATDPSANHAASQGGHRSFALESLQHQIRNLGQQYTSTTPVQRIITLEKGVALDFDALARDGKAQSKELYTWGQHEDADLTDVTDRLAFLNFVQGSLSATLAVKLDGARSPLKALRAAEVVIAPKRNIRNGLHNQIGRIEHNQEKGGERRLAELREQLSRAERNDEQLEKELELLKRKAIRESEQRKWEAIQEYGEKLALLSQAAKPIIGALPTLPPTTANPYAGAEVTATARASLQHALDNYKPGHVNLHVQVGGDLSRSDTRSFGETHASELSSLAAPSAGQDSHPGLSLTPPIPEPASTEEENQSVHLSPQSQPVKPNESASAISAQSVPAITPTIGETGVSLFASGPAAVSGSVHDVPATLQHTSGSGAGRLAESLSKDLYGIAPPKTESAEEEKRRLEREERERVLAAASGSEVSETAEEEKKRLGREERERVLAGGARNTTEKEGDELPPYQDFQE